MNTKNALILAMLIICPFLFSCGNSTSNPLEKYKDIKQGPTHETPSEHQTVAKSELAFITFVGAGTNDVNYESFIEGKDNRILIQVTKYTPDISSYSLELEEFPVGDRPKLEPTDKPDIFALSWKPPIGTLASEKPQSFKAIFKFVVLEKPQLRGRTNSLSLNLIVERENSLPKFIGISDLSAGIDEDAAKPTVFSVDIEDPATNSTNPGLPSIFISSYIWSNTEVYRADGMRYVKLSENKHDYPQNPKKISATKWKYFYEIDVIQLPLDKDRVGNDIPSATAVEVCFYMQVFSVIHTFSEEQKPVCFKARYAAQPPVVNFNDPNFKEVKAESENVIPFKVSSTHALSVISTKSADQFVAGLSGQKSLICQPEKTDSKNSLLCELKWTPPCIPKAVVKTLSLKFDSTLGTKTKSTTFTREITILPASDSCEKPKPSPGATK